MSTGHTSHVGGAKSSHRDQDLQRAVLRAGLATEEQIQSCRKLQAKLAGERKYLSLLELLVRKGILSPDQARLLQDGDSPMTRIPGYQILEKLGQGSMGVVYKARQLSMNRVVAVKVLKEKLKTNEEFLSRFRREAEMAGQLSSNHVVLAIDAGEADGQFFFVMEYVEGPTVKDELERGRVFSESDALDIMLQVAEGLEHAHKRGLVHRDMKPDNIILTPDGTAKLADLGLARPTTDQSLADAEEGLAIGTPYYIAPEQIRGQKDVDARADIYSLGATFYHMLTGRVPFSGSTSREVMLAHLRKKLVPPDHLNINLSGGVGEVVETMMAKDRDRRYASCGDLIIDLKSLLAGAPPLLAREKMQSSVLAGLSMGDEAVGPRSRLIPFLIVCLVLSLLGNVALSVWIAMF